jgi:heme exporter protein A
LEKTDVRPVAEISPMTHFSGQNLTCIRSERPVFEGLDFTLEAGDALVLTGRNGAGKSSLLRLMTGLLPPAGGTIFWNNQPIEEDREAHHHRLHYVGHLDALKPVLSAVENLAFWAGLGGGPTDRATVISALERFGIAHAADLPSRFLSAGQRRRVNLARLLARPAPIWLLDEPTTALDSEAEARLTSAVEEHRAGGGLVVAATHSDLNLRGAQTLALGERQAVA